MREQGLNRFGSAAVLLLPRNPFIHILLQDLERDGAIPEDDVVEVAEVELLTESLL